MKIIILIEGIIKQIRELVMVLTTKEEITFDQIETMVWKAVLEIGRLLIEGIIRIREASLIKQSRLLQERWQNTWEIKI